MQLPLLLPQLSMQVSYTSQTEEKDPGGWVTKETQPYVRSRSTVGYGRPLLCPVTDWRSWVTRYVISWCLLACTITKPMVFSPSLYLKINECTGALYASSGFLIHIPHKKWNSAINQHLELPRFCRLSFPQHSTMISTCTEIGF